MIAMNPIVVYLDQCAVSEMVNNPKLGGLRSFMEAKAGDGLIVCPLPFETILESSRCGKAETRNAIFAFYKKASIGLLFRSFFDILADELLTLVRPDWGASAFSFTDSMEKLRDFSAESCVNFSNLIENKNSILKKFNRNSIDKNSTFEETLESVSLEPVSLLWRDLRRIVDSNGSVEASSLECPKVSKLLLQRGVTNYEAENLAEAIRFRKMETIPVVYCHNRLAAIAANDEISRGASKYCYNDIIDQERMSTAIAFSDFAITDRAMVSRVNRSRVCEQFHCRVFSVADLIDFEDVLMERIPRQF